MSMEEALREQVQGLDHPGGLHTYIGDTHASLCVACTWLHWLQSVLKEWDERQAAGAAENAKYACPKCCDQKRYMVMRPGMIVNCSECAVPVGEQQQEEA